MVLAFVNPLNAIQWAAPCMNGALGRRLIPPVNACLVI
ncbi:unannotated protein [freshwater metagenome]|uniref:Unannotated protein n=1 Tax=freshwater metagenome TaxID=449393 RepID=A0A6J6CWS4_9ZZZZ